MKQHKFLGWSWIKDKIFEKQIRSKHSQIINDGIGLWFYTFKKLIRNLTAV